MRLKLSYGPLRSLAPVILPLGLLASGALSATVTPLRSSLLVTAFAWGIVAVFLGLKIGFRSVLKDGGTRKISLLAGLMFALGRICERIAGDRMGLWRSSVGATTLGGDTQALTSV